MTLYSLGFPALTSIRYIKFVQMKVKNKGNNSSLFLATFSFSLLDEVFRVFVRCVVDRAVAVRHLAEGRLVL